MSIAARLAGFVCLWSIASFAQDAHDKCVQNCEVLDKKCIDGAHDSGERQICVKQVELCRAACPASTTPPPLKDDYCLDKTAPAPASEPEHGFSKGIEINPKNDDHAWTRTCMPPVLQAVQATSFSIVFKVKDADIGHKVRVALYEGNEGTDHPTRFWTVVPRAGTGYRDDSTNDTPTGRYEKFSFTGLQTGHTYHYNLNVEGEGTCAGTKCDTCTNDCTLTGGNWFDKRRVAVTAPQPVAHGTSPVRILVLGDSRDGGQDECMSGSWTQNVPLSAAQKICGGAAAERDAYGKAIAAFAAAFHTNLVAHGGDIAGSDGFKETLEYWAVLGEWWRDISTGFAYGNHEFATPQKRTDLSEQEILGGLDDTKSDEMIAVPERPTSLGGIEYPAPGPTFYSQTYGNVHLIYVNAQDCPLDAMGTHSVKDADQCKTPDKRVKNPDGSESPADAKAVFETDGAGKQPCHCFDQATAQRKWLIDDLKAANNDKQVSWIVVSHHKAIWSNGPLSAGDTAWTNTIGKVEWRPSLAGNPRDLTQRAQPDLTDHLIPLDALYQMYNVDLVLSSHAHYYEVVNDTRHREKGDALPHMLVGGSAAAEQLYQCPQAKNCDVKLPLNDSAQPEKSILRLPVGVNFERAADEVFAFGDLHFEGNTLKRTAFSLTATSGLPDVNLKRAEIGSAVSMTSRKSKILKGASEKFNGCNLVYPFPADSAAQPATQKNVNCTVQ